MEFDLQALDPDTPEGAIPMMYAYAFAYVDPTDGSLRQAPDIGADDSASMYGILGLVEKLKLDVAMKMTAVQDALDQGEFHEDD